MIYGLNFGGPAIPDIPRSAFRKWKPRIRIRDEADGKLTVAVLVGIGQSAAERDRMLAVAHNGHRRLHVEAKMTAAGTWYGIYTY